MYKIFKCSAKIPNKWINNYASLRWSYDFKKIVLRGAITDNFFGSIWVISQTFLNIP